MKNKKAIIGWISLLFILLGPVICFGIPCISENLEGFFWTYGFLIFLSCQIIALILGIIAWRSVTGKIGVILAILLMIGIILYFSFGQDVVTPLP